MSLHPRGARAALSALLTCCLAGLALAGSASASGCAGADVAPDAADLRVARGATLCLLNEERTSRGLVALKGNARLVAAAEQHAGDMVDNTYFAHDALDGSDFGLRVENAGYLGRRKSWVLGENLAWGSGSLATPAAIVAGWMGSAGHRDNILTPEFRDIGISILPGVPVQTELPGATYDTEFGQRSTAVTSERATTGLTADAARRRPSAR
jgi:hypothetical protein